MLNRKILFPLFATIIQLFVLLFYFHLKGEFNQPPHSIHTWRQCDGASFALHYFNFNNALFHPQMYNMEIADGEAASEFPIVYWLAAKLSGSTFEPANIRYLYFLFSIVALLLANAAAIAITGSVVLGFYLAFFPFLSTVFSFYSNNFLPDVPATSSMIAALSCFYFYFKMRKTYWLWASVIGFSLAGLLKVTSFAPYLVLLAAIYFEIFFSKILFKKQLVHSLFHALIMFMPVFITLAWIIYIRSYNHHYGSIYFRTSSFPFWELDAAQKAGFWYGLTERWADEYFSQVTGKLALLMMPVSVLLAFVRNKRFAWFLLLFLLLQVLVLLLFAGQYLIHDYYAIVLFSAPLIAYCVVFYYLKKYALFRILLPLAIIPYLISEINYTQGKIQARLAAVDADEWSAPLAKCTPHLEENGLQKEDKILVLGNVATNVALYTLQHKGWTDFNFVLMSKQEHISSILNFNIKRTEYIYTRVDKRGQIEMMKAHGLKWIIFFPDKRDDYPELKDFRFQKQFALEGFEFCKI